MKKISQSILLAEAKKESTLTLREAIISHVDFDLEYFCRKNVKKDWRQAYGFIKERFKYAHDWEVKPNRLYILNYFFRNYVVVKNLARDWWEADGFKSEKEAAKIYNTAALFLNGIYDNIIAGQYDLYCRGYGNHWSDWYQDID